MQVCGSSKSEDSLNCLPQPIICKLETLGKWSRERKWPKSAREREIWKCVFLKRGIPFRHHQFWCVLDLSLFTFEVCVPWICPFTSTFSSATPHFTFDVNFLYFAMSHKSLIFSFPLTHEKKSCHICLTFTLTMPPRMGAFPPCFPLESSFLLPLRRT